MLSKMASMRLQEGEKGGLTSPIAASYSPAALEGPLMRKLLVSTTHCAEESVTEASRRDKMAGATTLDSAGLPLAEGRLCESISLGLQGNNGHLVSCSSTIQRLRWLLLEPCPSLHVLTPSEKDRIGLHNFLGHDQDSGR